MICVLVPPSYVFFKSPSPDRRLTPQSTPRALGVRAFHTRFPHVDENIIKNKKYTPTTRQTHTSPDCSSAAPLLAHTSKTPKRDPEKKKRTPSKDEGVVEAGYDP